MLLSLGGCVRSEAAPVHHSDITQVLGFALRRLCTSMMEAALSIGRPLGQPLFSSDSIRITEAAGAAHVSAHSPRVLPHTQPLSERVM